MRWLTGAIAALVLWPAAPAAGQEPGSAPASEEPASVLLVLDSSKSMEEPRADGQTRLEAAQEAARELVAALPDDARVGVRVYGARVAQATREEGCRDTELVVPVGPLDRDAVVAAIDGLEGRGRTPIGRSLLAAGDDLPAQGRRTVILVSDGGDNCSPPGPCAAARELAGQGVDLSIQVVGLQVTERVRRQLRCIAEAGGGAYVDAQDPGELRDQLLALFARAFRGYEPTGTPIEGGPTATAAAEAGPGRWLDDIAAGEARWYAVDVPAGSRLLATATVVTPPDDEDSGIVDLRIVGPDGEEVAGDRESHDPWRSEPITPVAALMERPAGEGGPPPGRYAVGVSVDNAEEAAFGTPPLEVELHVAEPGEAVEPGAEGAAPTPTPTPTATPDGASREPRGEQGDTGAVELGGIGLVGTLLGLAAGALAARRRR